MNTVIVLAVHGTPPRDFPRGDMAEFFELHNRLEHATPQEAARLKNRHDMLESRMRSWPRTAQNDPFWAASQEMAKALQEITGAKIIVGFNEFCAPTLGAALDEAARNGAERVVITTPMLTKGGKHAETEIPEIIARARTRYPDVTFFYAWPFPVPEIAAFLGQQIKRLAEAIPS